MAKALVQSNFTNNGFYLRVTTGGEKEVVVEGDFTTADTSTNGTYYFVGSSPSNKCVTYNQFKVAPLQVQVRIGFIAKDFRIVVDKDSSNLSTLSIGPYNAGLTPGQCWNAGLYYGDNMYVDIQYDNGTSIATYSGWNVYCETSGMTYAQTSVNVGSTYDNTLFGYFNKTMDVDTYEIIRIHTRYNAGTYNGSGYTLGYSPSTSQKITYNFDSPFIQINVSRTGYVTMYNSYCSGYVAVQSGTTGSTTIKQSIDYYLERLNYNTSRSSGYADTSSGSSCPYNCSYDYCGSNYGCTGDNSYNESGYTY